MPHDCQTVQNSRGLNNLQTIFRGATSFDGTSYSRYVVQICHVYLTQIFYFTVRISLIGQAELSSIVLSPCHYDSWDPICGFVFLHVLGVGLVRGGCKRWPYGFVDRPGTGRIGGWDLVDCPEGRFEPIPRTTRSDLSMNDCWGSPHPCHQQPQGDLEAVDILNMWPSYRLLMLP